MQKIQKLKFGKEINLNTNVKNSKKWKFINENLKKKKN